MSGVPFSPQTPKLMKSLEHNHRIFPMSQRLRSAFRTAVKHMGRDVMTDGDLEGFQTLFSRDTTET